MPPATDQSFTVPNAAAMHDLGRQLSEHLKAGDVVVMTGALGAGKTTLTQGIAAGLDVQGRVTSPTFVIAREHPSLGSGPGLLHVDAYRLDSVRDVDDLDLEMSMTDAVTVVEWGRDLADHLGDSVIEVQIDRLDNDTRHVVVRGLPDSPRTDAH